jgi:hypothetical protein
VDAWMRGFVRDEFIPLETLDLDAAAFSRATGPLKEEQDQVSLCDIIIIGIALAGIPIRRSACLRWAFFVALRNQSSSGATRTLPPLCAATAQR